MNVIAKSYDEYRMEMRDMLHKTYQEKGLDYALRTCYEEVKAILHNIPEDVVKVLSKIYDDELFIFIEAVQFELSQKIRVIKSEYDISEDDIQTIGIIVEMGDLKKQKEEAEEITYLNHWYEYFEGEEAVLKDGSKRVVPWKELSLAAKNVIERCWGLNNDEPTTFSVQLFDKVCGRTITLDTLKDIILYQRTHSDVFSVSFINNEIIVKGLTKFNSKKED